MAASFALEAEFLDGVTGLDCEADGGLEIGADVCVSVGVDIVFCA